MCLLCGVEIDIYDIFSLIMEREGAERAILGNLVGGNSPSGLLRYPCFLMWSSCETDLHNCAYDSHSPFGVPFPIPLILPWSLLLLFLFSIYCPKMNSSVVSLCHFLSILRLFNCPLPCFLICLNGCGYCSLNNWTTYKVLPEQGIFCLFVNWESDFCPLRQLTYSRKHFLRAGLSHPSFSWVSPTSASPPQFHSSSPSVPGLLEVEGLVLQLLDLVLIYLFVWLFYFILNVKHKPSCHSLPSWLLKMFLAHNTPFWQKVLGTVKVLFISSSSLVVFTRNCPA